MTRFHDVHDPLAASLRRVKQRVEAIGGVPPVPALAHLSFPASGKGTRARLALLSAEAVGGRVVEAEVVGTLVELAHLASLHHDDCLDGAHARRGRPTAYALLGTHRAILVGDYVIAHVFRLVSELPDRLAAGIVGAAVGELVAGELEQASLRGQAEADLGALRRVARRKTGALFGLAGMLGGRCGERRALGRDLGVFGAAFGEAFQLLDDVLDYATCPGEEPPGGDFAGGVPTTPLRLALDRVSPGDRARLVTGLAHPGSVPTEEAVALVAASGALAVTARAAAEVAMAGVEALAAVPDGPARQELAEMATGLVGGLARWSS